MSDNQRFEYFQCMHDNDPSKLFHIVKAGHYDKYGARITTKTIMGKTEP